MAVSRYYKYKCKKCSYIFTKFQSEVLIPVSCPKCKGEVEVISANLRKNQLDDVIETVKNVFRKDWIKSLYL